MDRTTSGKEGWSWLFRQRLPSHCRAWFDRDPVARTRKLLLCFTRIRRRAADVRFRWRSFLRTRSPMLSNESSNSVRPLRLRRPPSRASAANETPTPVPGGPAATERQLAVTAAEINGLIAANKKARGHAYVTLSGNTATVQLSIPTDKDTGTAARLLEWKFQHHYRRTYSADGLRVSKIEANGYSVPSGISRWSYRGRSFMGYAAGSGCALQSQHRGSARRQSHRPLNTPF